MKNALLMLEQKTSLPLLTLFALSLVPGLVGLRVAHGIFPLNFPSDIKPFFRFSGDSGVTSESGMIF